MRTRSTTPVPTQPGTRRRAALIVFGAGGVVLVLVIALVSVLLSSLSAPDPTIPAPTPAERPPAGDGGGWNVVDETELATRPMPQLPAAAALPQPLAAAGSDPPLRLPAAVDHSGPVPRGFPPTPEGALAQLVALTSAGLANADPQTYAGAYQAVAARGAPPVEETPLHQGLVEIRSRAGLPTTGVVRALTFDWTAGGGLIKGTTDRGRYVVACVIGQLDSGANGQILSTGAGDCQAMRYVDGQWWISPGAPAAPAPLAWPGSKPATEVGYRAVADAA